MKSSKRSLSAARTGVPARLALPLTAGAFALGLACTNSSSDVRVLARNVLVSASNAASIRAANAGTADPRVDERLVVRAQNVVYEQSARADLTAADVQAALESITVTLDSVLPGTWSIQNFSTWDLAPESTGRVRFSTALDSFSRAPRRERLQPFTL